MRWRCLRGRRCCRWTSLGALDVGDMGGNHSGVLGCVPELEGMRFLLGDVARRWLAGDPGDSGPQVRGWGPSQSAGVRSGGTCAPLGRYVFHWQVVHPGLLNRMSLKQR